VAGLALLESEDSVLTEKGIHDGKRTSFHLRVDLVEVVQFSPGRLVPQDGMPLGECASLDVLPRQPYSVSLQH